MSERRNLDTERFFAHYATMQRIRAFERNALRAAREGLATGAIHASIGQEAVASGICGNLGRTDLLLSNHRGHGHTLAKGADPGAMMRELFGREGGVCGGKGGSMHIADFGVGMLGANGVVGANILIAAGGRARDQAPPFAFAGDERVVICIFGDGAVNRGPFLEGLNWAAVYRLPVLFVCEGQRLRGDDAHRGADRGPRPEGAGREPGAPFPGKVDGNDIVAVDAIARGVHRRRPVPASRASSMRRRGGSRAIPPPTPERTATRPRSRARWADDPVARCETLLVEEAGVDRRTARGEPATTPSGEMEAVFEEARAAGWPPP